MLHRASSARLGLILVLCGSIAAPAMAYKWPGDGPSPGGALAAKVIGQHSAGVLSASDIGELDAFLAKAASELARKEETRKGSGRDSPSFEAFIRALSEDYAKK